MSGRLLIPSCRPRAAPAAAVLAATALWLLAGCGLEDSALVECRCTPESNRTLFPACPRVVAQLWVTTAGDTLDATADANAGTDRRLVAVELWITADGDTLNAATDWITVRGDQVQRGEPGSLNPFQEGIAECPVGPRLILTERIRPSSVLFNLKNILRAQPEARNADQYMDQLSDDFSFVPDLQDVELYPEVYDITQDTLWNREQERRFAQAILDPTTIGTITVDRWYESARDERIVSEDQLQETYVFPYELSLVRLGTGTGDDTRLELKGTMEVDLITPTLETPVWSVRQWRDFRDLASAKRSWGELRAELAR